MMKRLLRMAARLISRRARRHLLLMSLSFCLVISFYITLQSLINSTHEVSKGVVYQQVIKYETNRSDTLYVDEWTEGQTCKRPRLELWHPSMKQHFVTPEPLHCADAQQDWVYVQNGTFRIYPVVEKRVGNVMCEYRPLIRVTDDIIKLGNATRPFKDGDRILSDFFEVRCISARGAVYKNLHSAILPNQELIKHRRSIKRPKDASGLNILMFGFDSVSRLNWMRNLPKSYDYFVKHLEGIVLEGYNIVGDGTPQALLPILAGKREEELPEARRGFTNAQPVDEHPWIWKELKKYGYVSQWGEDGAPFGTFNYRMMGFVDPPVDHYMRPFYLWIEEYYYKNNYAYCIGSKPRHVNMLQWIVQFFEAYPNLPKFSFLFHSEFSHERFSTLSLVDDNFFEFLKYMNGSGYLDNTLLVLMSDHGARFTDVRQSEQGKYEERLPFFSFRLPNWFRQKHPDVVQNLKNNRKVLTTPFDVHDTFLDIINFNRPNRHKEQHDIRTSRSISLLRPVSENRTCHDADIATHWCTCMDWIETSLADRHVVAAAREVVEVMNELMSNQKDECEILDVDQIIAAVKFAPNLKMLQFKQSSDHHGRLGDFSDLMDASSEQYQITMRTRPGGGTFEATVRHDTSHGGGYYPDISAISRINAYGNQPHCVSREFPHLRQFCYCKTQPAKAT